MQISFVVYSLLFSAEVEVKSSATRGIPTLIPRAIIDATLEGQSSGPATRPSCPVRESKTVLLAV